MPTDLLHPDFNPTEKSPGELLDAIWKELKRASNGGPHPWRLPSLATVMKGLPYQRTVVLRDALLENFHLLAHTDIRSPKIEHLTHQPSVSWLFYDPHSRVQLLASGRVTIYTSGELADREWRRLVSAPKRDYLSPAPPGTPIDQPICSTDLQSSLESNDGRSNFCVLDCDVSELDVLFLRPAHHLRMCLKKDGLGWDFTWLSP